MTYPSEPLLAIGQAVHVLLGEDAGRSRVRLILLGDPDAVDQSVIELERRGYCDSYAWTPPLIIRENAAPIQPLPGELMRFYQRWYPLSRQRIPF